MASIQKEKKKKSSCFTASKGVCEPLHCAAGPSRYVHVNTCLYKAVQQHVTGIDFNQTPDKKWGPKVGKIQKKSGV